MEVNYKLLLDYVDDQLEGLEARQVMARVREEESWQIALRRIRLVLINLNCNPYRAIFLPGRTKT